MNLNVNTTKTFTVLGVRRDTGVTGLPAGFPLAASAPGAVACSVDPVTFKGSITTPVASGTDAMTLSSTQSGVAPYTQALTYVLDPAAIVGLTVRWD